MAVKLGPPQVGANRRGISCYVHLPHIETIVKPETTDRHRFNALNSKSPLISPSPEVCLVFTGQE